MSKFILVSGGSKGIGKEIIRKFAANGFNIVTCARSEKGLKSLQTEIQEKYSVNLDYQALDLSDKQSTLDFADFALSKGVPQVLVNNTGVFIPGEILEEEEGNLEMMIQTNLYSAYHLSRKIIPAMKPQAQGHIFNICSIASIIAYPNGGSYSISKFALLGFSKVLREELKSSGLKVTSVLPGATLTASWEGVDIPPERLMKASEVADSIWAAYDTSARTVIEEIILRPQLGDL